MDPPPPGRRDFCSGGAITNAQNSRLDGEEMLVLRIGTAAPHELRQADQVFRVVSRVAPAGGNLGGDLLVRGRAEVDGVVGRGDVDQGRQGALTLLLRGELHRLRHVTSQHDLPHVKVLEGLLDLGGSHLVGNSPCAGLWGKQVEEGCQRENIYTI